MADRDRMPIVAEYKGVGLHDFQPESRIREVVIPAIDAVLVMEDQAELFAYLKDITKPPEARLLAEKKLLEPVLEAREAGRKAKINPDLVRAHGAGLDSLNWADPARYAPVLHLWGPDDPQPARRPPQYGEALLAARKAAG